MLWCSALFLQTVCVQWRTVQSESPCVCQYPSLAPQRSRAPPAGWSRWAWRCFRTWDHQHLWLSPGPLWSLWGGGGITQSELAQAAVPVDGEIKWLCHSPAGSVCLARGVAAVQIEEGGGWGRVRGGMLTKGQGLEKRGWGAALAFHSWVRWCRCVWQPLQP